MVDDAALRRKLIESGPSVNDVDAAVACLCGCHPRVSDFHDGGVSCSCQQTPEQREAALEALLAVFKDMRAFYSADDSELQAVATELGVTEPVIEVHGAPFVITGIVQGRFFYLRERHGMYRVAIAPDENPLLDVWQDGHHVEVTVREGVETDFWVDGKFSASEALRVAVRSVEDWLVRARCSHDRMFLEGSRFCPNCGFQNAVG